MTVVCITHLLKDRKLEELLGAVERCPDVYAIIGGKGVLEPLVRQCAAKNPRIRYVGFARGVEIPDCTCASDVVYYGCDPENPNTRFSAPNKLYEALAAGRPLITGDFGEIADVVRSASCGIVLSHYGVEEICQALEVMRDPVLRQSMADNAKQFGRESMNWDTGAKVLYQEYSAMVPGALRQPAARVVGELG